MRYDLAVIGGGPAGATAAWAAAKRGLRVVLLERGEFPRDKVCGEFISAEAHALLAAMTPGMMEQATPVRRAVFAAGTARREFLLPAPAIGISRLALDAALWEAAGMAGAALLPKTAVDAVERVPDGYRLKTAQMPPMVAAHLIVAAGRWWHIRGLAQPRRVPVSPWLGVKAHLRGIRVSGVEVYLFRGGYCGLAPVENGWTNCCCLVQHERARELSADRKFTDWILKVADCRALRARLAGAQQVTATVTTFPVEIGARRSTLDDVLLAGDASGFVDPFTGDGIARALLSGALAADSLGNPAAYQARLQHASGRSYRLGGWLRTAVGAPACVQTWAVAVMARPAMARRFVGATRWRGTAAY